VERWARGFVRECRWSHVQSTTQGARQLRVPQQPRPRHRRARASSGCRSSRARTTDPPEPAQCAAAAAPAPQTRPSQLRVPQQPRPRHRRARASSGCRSSRARATDAPAPAQGCRSRCARASTKRARASSGCRSARARASTRCARASSGCRSVCSPALRAAAAVAYPDDGAGSVYVTGGTIQRGRRRDEPPRARRGVRPMVRAGAQGQRRHVDYAEWIWGTGGHSRGAPGARIRPRVQVVPRAVDDAGRAAQGEVYSNRP